MDSGIQKRLDQELRQAMQRLRQAGGTVAIEEVTRAVGDGSGLADEMDMIAANERREIEFATRELLVERVRKLSTAIERLKDGEYGRCSECDEPIAPARLRAMPEVETCVRCQDRIERFGRTLQTVEVGAADDDD